MVFARANTMAARYLEAMQCLNLIAPERLAEALKIADARVGRQSFQEGCDSGLVKMVSSVPNDQFRWFRLVLRRMAEKYERRTSMPPAAGDLVRKTDDESVAVGH